MTHLLRIEQMSNLSHLHSATKTKGKKESPFSNIQRNNYNFVMILITALGLAILVQAFRWQVLESEKFKLMARQQYEDNDTHSAQRGIIQASDGTILAVDQPTWNIYATLSTDERERKIFFDNKDKFVATVSSILAVENETISSKITDDFVYVPLAKGVDNEKKNALQSANIFGTDEVNRQGFGLYFEKV